MIWFTTDELFFSTNKIILTSINPNFINENTLIGYLIYTYILIYTFNSSIYSKSNKQSTLYV